MDTDLPLDIVVGCGPYDRMLALKAGAFDGDGYRFLVRDMNVAEIPAAAYGTGVLDIAEVSIGEHLVQIEEGNCQYRALPVFASMAFRHDSIYVAAGGDIERPEQLAGRRIGCSMHFGTTVIWVRDMLQSQYGVDPASIQWVVGKLDTPTSSAKVPLSTLTVIACADGDSLQAMLERGELDAIISYQVPAAVAGGTMRRLIGDVPAAERAYFQQSGAIPLLHLMVCRSSLLDGDRGFAERGYRAFLESKDRALANLRQTACYTSSLPSQLAAVENATAMLGADFWPYGIDINRRALDIFLLAAHRQGLTHKLFTIDDLFPDFTQA